MVDYESDKASYWKNCDVWTLSEVQFLLDGQWPDKGKEPPSSLTMHLVESKKEIVHDMGNGHILVAEERELHVFHPVPDGVTLIQLVEEAIAAGRLSPLKSHETPKYKRQFEVRFRPSEVIAWATSRRCFPDFVFSQASNCASPNAPVMESDATTLSPVPVVAGGKKWTLEKLAELTAYRDTHTMPETASKFGISEQRIRQLLPSGKTKAELFAGLIHRMK